MNLKTKHIILSHQLKQRKRKGQSTLYLLDNKELGCGADAKLREFDFLSFYWSNNEKYLGKAN